MFKHQMLLNLIILKRKNVEFFTEKPNIFSTNVYRKKTFTGLFSGFSSFIYKINLIKTLLFCAYEICSTFQNFQIKNIVIILTS